MDIRSCPVSLTTPPLAFKLGIVAVSTGNDHSAKRRSGARTTRQPCRLGDAPGGSRADVRLPPAIRNAGMRWKGPVAWAATMGQFAILFEEHFPASSRFRPESANARIGRIHS